jgi:hypothetical protein
VTRWRATRRLRATTGRNITLTLDQELLKKVRVLAARRNLSVSALLRAELERLVREDEAYVAARRKAFARLSRTTHLGGGPLPERDELHDRGVLR